MKLKALLAKAGISIPSESHPALEQEVKGLTTNSIACQSGDLFLGMPGTRVDGGEFWPNAIASGAVAAFICETAAEKTQDRITAEH
ncbi:MAG: Mur ligase domain-containing protein, partial [Planktothrix sp.]